MTNLLVAWFFPGFSDKNLPSSKKRPDNTFQRACGQQKKTVSVHGSRFTVHGFSDFLDAFLK